MHAVKFTVFYVIAALAALAAASPIPVAAPDAAVRVAGLDLLAREPLPVAEAVDVLPRICRRGPEGECL